MKNLLTLLVLFVTSLGFSQNIQPTFKKSGDLVKATYYYENGNIKTQGFFKNNKLTGKWVAYDEQGNKKQVAYYKEGKKDGKWMIWTKDAVKEINYKNNQIVYVNSLSTDNKVALTD
jgi:antitoxin component YwqK of YwqJK toxin-antitoxin module